MCSAETPGSVDGAIARSFSALLSNLLDREVRKSGILRPLSYYHSHWTRDGAALLDELGADHVEAFSTGGFERDLQSCDFVFSVQSSEKCRTLGRLGQETSTKACQRQLR
jgi:hypothetical protein